MDQQSKEQLNIREMTKEDVPQVFDLERRSFNDSSWTIDIIGAPSTFGQRKLGVDLGPTAIRYAGLISRLKQLDLDVYDKGDIKVPKSGE